MYAKFPYYLVLYMQSVLTLHAKKAGGRSYVEVTLYQCRDRAGGACVACSVHTCVCSLLERPRITVIRALESTISNIEKSLKYSTFVRLVQKIP